MLTPATVSSNFRKASELSGLDFSGEPPGFHELRSLSARLYGKQAGDSFAQHLPGYNSGIMTAKYRDDRGGSGTGLRSGNEFGLNDFELTFIMH
ncbi:tyrosine-type recombinase/integrase [Raoultella ornithinolytica]|nr:tyrosine-type recombinase/integrase [Raoultella ornithinolytica]MDU0923281.1 tyrosine-type recombinase/integrase [Raoultella ornithinolytica]